MDEQSLFSPAAPQPVAGSPSSVRPTGFLDRPLLTPRYLPITSYYGHLGDTIHWSLRVYARITMLVRNLFPEELPLHTRFNPLDSSDMEEAIGWLHRLVCDRLFPVVDGSADEFYCDVGEGELPDTLLWLTPAVFGVNYDIDTNADAYSGADTRAFGMDGAVDFLMALAQELCEHGTSRFGTCAATDCSHLFYDVTRKGSRRFCADPRCASRTHTADHRARQRAT